MSRIVKRVGNFFLDHAAKQYERSMTRKLNAFGELLLLCKSMLRKCSERSFGHPSDIAPGRCRLLCVQHIGSTVTQADPRNTPDVPYSRDWHLFYNIFPFFRVVCFPAPFALYDNLSKLSAYPRSASFGTRAAVELCIPCTSQSS